MHTWTNMSRNLSLGFPSLYFYPSVRPSVRSSVRPSVAQLSNVVTVVINMVAVIRRRNNNVLAQQRLKSMALK